VTSLTERIRRALHDIDDHCTPTEREHYYAQIVAHVRSAAPMLLAAAPPLGDAVAEVNRALGDGSTYRLAIEAGAVVMTVRDAHDGHATVALTAVEAVRARADIDAVASGVGR
jgi:hypothetical protein